MAENSKIQWTNHTGNLWWGCTEVHAGCDNCYARIWDNRYNGNHWGNNASRRAIKSVWKDFTRWNRLAAEKGEIHNVFVGSMMDIFEKPMWVVDTKGEQLGFKTDKLRDRFFNEVVPACPNLMFLLLTKRPSNIPKFIPNSWVLNAPKNVMYGTSIVNQETTNKLVPMLLKANGKRFLSVEPMLDEISFRWASWHNWKDQKNGEQVIMDGKNMIRYDQHDGMKGIDWIIVGGESGNRKRPFNPDWARTIREQCKAAKVPFFMKQMDGIKDIPEDLMIREFPNINELTTK